MANQVTLTFAGDTKNVEGSFDRVGRSAKDMGDKVHESGGGFDRAGDAADGAETKAQGFSDVLAGTIDVGAGFKMMADGDIAGGLIGIGTGMADLAGGMSDFLLPALGKVKGAIMGMNLAFLSSPIFWVILAIVALVAVFVILWNKCEGFRNFWKGLWNRIKEAASAVGRWFKDTLWPWIRGAWDNIKGKAESVWNWLKGMPGKIKSAFSKVRDWISAPFRAAFNFIADAWNNTVGGLQFSIPSWVPGIGGNSFGVPRLPHFHSGGIIPGVVGTAVPIMGLAGERVSGPASRGGNDEWVHVDLGDLGDALLASIGKAVARRGGQASALGIRVTNGLVRA